MKKLFLLGAMVCALGMTTACKSGNNTDSDGNMASSSIETNSILNTKWIIDGSNRAEEDAIYIFINQDSSVIVSHRGEDIEYGYVSDANDDCIRIKMNGFSRAAKYESSKLYIDRKNNLLYHNIDAYKSHDPRKCQGIEQIPMSDYKGESVDVQDYQMATPRRSDSE